MHPTYEQTVTTEYDFVGKALKDQTVFTFLKNNQSTTINKRYEYDHAGRPTKVYHQVNSQEEVLMAENHYNELGEMIEKNLHSEDNGENFLQSVDYDYNIRGWLTRVNEPSLSQSNDNDLFGMELRYNNTVGLSSLGGDALYNGNISAMLWESDKNPGQRVYTYHYDNVNRLLQADYAEKEGSAWLQNNHYRVFDLGYDANGNILSLKRNGMIPGEGDYGETRSGYGLVDDLNYFYNGNRLINLGEDSDKELGLKKKTIGPAPTNDYLYDANGNMNTDNNKEMQLTYNHLNLPQTITFAGGALDYYYTAAGDKIVKGIGNQYTYYMNGFVYDSHPGNHELQYILTDEGRITKTAEGYQYEYFLKDHLGNTRVSFKAAGNQAELLQEDHYYPFGLELGGLIPRG